MNIGINQICTHNNTNGDCVLYGQDFIDHKRKACSVCPDFSTGDESKNYRKVYCENCMWCEAYPNMDCLHPINKIKKIPMDTFYSNESIMYREHKCKDKNKQNNCGDYEACKTGEREMLIIAMVLITVIMAGLIFVAKS